MKIEPKGINPYTINNISNFILFTNHRDAIIVEESDRRYAIFEMGVSHRNDSQYFDMIREKCFHQDVANEFYTYLLDFPAVNIHKIPETDLKREMINMSKPSAIKFMDDIFNNEEFKQSIFQDEKTIKPITLYEHYKNWCSSNGERNIVSNTKFGITIDNRIIKKHTMYGNMYEIA